MSADQNLDLALDYVRQHGYVAIKEKSYRQAQERQRIAEALRAAEQDRREGAEEWARSECEEQRRLRERLTFVYGMARAKGATIEELRGASTAAAALLPENGSPQ